jgi:hypothetical protein
VQIQHRAYRSGANDWTTWDSFCGGKIREWLRFLRFFPQQMLAHMVRYLAMLRYASLFTSTLCNDPYMWHSSRVFLRSRSCMRRTSFACMIIQPGHHVHLGAHLKQSWYYNSISDWQYGSIFDRYYNSIAAVEGSTPVSHIDQPTIGMRKMLVLETNLKSFPRWKRVKISWREQRK